jgi:murein tripeptide amidase MpaA
MKPLLYSSKDH